MTPPNTPRKDEVRKIAEQPSSLKFLEEAARYFEGRPTMVFAFPGGRGTADMVCRAKAAGIPVHHFGDRP